MWGATPLSKTEESLKSLNTEVPSALIIDTLFTSPIQILRNLVHLSIKVSCRDESDGGSAISSCNDHFTDLATTLPRLESLLLGRACFQNTCATTVVCLLPISVHCVKLDRIEIHFIQRASLTISRTSQRTPQFQELRSLPKCTLSRLDVYRIPLTVDELCLGIVVGRMIGIFPSLERCEGSS